MPEPGIGASGNHHRLRGAADHVGAHKAQGVALKRVGLLRLAGLRHFLNRQGFSGQRCLGHKQVTRLNHAQIRRDHIPGGELDNIARHQLVDRQFHPVALALVIDDAQHRRGVAHHRFQGIRRFGRTGFLDKVQQRRNTHHQHNHYRGEQVFRGVGDGGQHGQQNVERVTVAEPQMHPPRLRLLSRQLVFTVSGACLLDFSRVQPFRVRVKGVPQFLFIEPGHFQAVLAERGWNRRMGDALLSRHRIALYQTARKVAAKLCEQLPG